MVRKHGWISDDKLLEIAEEVLTGKTNRETLAQQRQLSAVNHRHVLAYVGVALMLATRYQLDDDNGVRGSLRSILYSLMYEGTKAKQDHSDGINEYGVDRQRLQVSAVELGLYPQGKHGQPVVLDPPVALKELVDSHRGNPAIREFLKEAGVEDEPRPSEVREADARRVVQRFNAKHGREGLVALLTEVRAALEK